MRRNELLIKVLRESVEFPHNDGDTDSVSDLEFVQYLNDGQDQIYGEIVDAHSNFYLTTALIDLVANQQQYTLPTDVYMGSKIKKVEYKYGSGAQEYYILRPGTEFDLRTHFTTTVPYLYVRGKDYLKISPLPDSNQTSALRVTYTKKPRRLDIRRGIISSASKTGSTLNSLTISLTPSLNKDSGTVSAARDLLNVSDYICVVNSDGTSVLDAVPIDSYDSSTGIITVKSGFTTTVAQGTFAGNYIVTGKYSTTHSELPDNCERYLLLYTTLKLLRRGGNQFETQEARNELGLVTQNILDSFANPDDDVYRLKIDELWENA